MYGKGTLAATGASLTILGFSMSLSLFAALVVLLVIGGALIYRVANRRNRYVSPAVAAVTSGQETRGHGG